MSSFLDIEQLAALLRTKRAGRSLREVAQEISEVSPSTLSRIENGKMPDMDTFLRVCDWLHVSPEEFIKGTDDPEREEVSPLERIEAYLRADQVLDPETADALSKVIRAAYKAASEGKLGGDKHG